MLLDLVMSHCSRTMFLLSMLSIISGRDIGYLRILASDEPKNSKNERLLNVLPDNFVKYTIFQKSERYFFGQPSIDKNCALTFEKRPLVEELKLKIQRSACFFFTFSISSQPLEGTFQI